MVPWLSSDISSWWFLQKQYYYLLLVLLLRWWVHSSAGHHTKHFYRALCPLCYKWVYQTLPVPILILLIVYRCFSNILFTLIAFIQFIIFLWATSYFMLSYICIKTFPSTHLFPDILTFLRSITHQCTFHMSKTLYTESLTYII